MMVDEIYELKASTTKKIFILLGAGLVFLILGIVLNMGGGHEHASEAHGAVAEVAHHGSPLWLKRVFANLWLVNVYFIGIAIIGVFFVTVQYASQAGWFTTLLRVPMSFGWYLPIGGIVLLLIFLLGKHDLFHWTHEGLFDEGNKEEYDSIIAGKSWFLNSGQFLVSSIIFIGVWILLFWKIRQASINEDEIGGVDNHKKMYKLSAIFLVFFAVSSSIGSWNWVMSIDAHWFSTLFGWYMFSSWLVAGLCMITFVTILLRQAGYLKFVTNNHLHDLGKFIFGFSIFWTYLWFSQFFLYWYADLPEEVAYFQFRFENFKGIFFVNLFINFLFPFLALMTRDAKRTNIFLSVVCVVLLLGHWLDFYMMIMPGTLKTDSGFGFIELGSLALFLGAFLFVMLKTLSKAGLVAKKHPMLDESLHHHT